jgi:small nuclear ribonucleoprotein
MKPLDVLGELLGEQVSVRLKNGIIVTGVLKAFDIHVNLVLENATFKDQENEQKIPNKVFLRGDMVIFIF